MKERKRRASTSDAARNYRQAGHDDAKLFAKKIGMPDDYRNDPKAKKDVIDKSGDAHSVKSGNKKWQIFLYTASRFENDFAVMNGMGELLVDCINCFPRDYREYAKDKSKYKELLKKSMEELKNKLSQKNRLRVFLQKSIFNGTEVNYWTIKHNDKFHVFWRDDVLDLLTKEINVENSVARRIGEVNSQKVLFKANDLNLGEIEMRNDGPKPGMEIPVHYREIKFNMYKLKAINILQNGIEGSEDFGNDIIAYGKACNKFKQHKM